MGFENRAAIERKTKSDAYGSLGRARDRFRREVERLGDLDFGAIVVESAVADFLRPPLYSEVSPRSAIATLLAWSVRYGVPVYFADDRRHGQAVTRSLLEKYWWYHGREVGHE